MVTKMDRLELLDRLHTDTGEVYLEIYAVAGLPIHYHVWRGLMKDQEQKVGLLRVGELLVARTPKGAIHNVVELQAGWEPMQNFLTTEWLPQYKDLAVKTALVMGESKDPFTAWSTTEFMQRTGGRFPIYRTYAEALAWLVAALAIEA